MSLLEFYGRECPHCRRMEPLVTRLEKEQKVAVKKLEVWHDEANARQLTKMDRGNCGGVPYFYNTATKKFICGETVYEELRRWAQGKK